MNVKDELQAATAYGHCIAWATGNLLRRVSELYIDIRYEDNIKMDFGEIHCNEGSGCKWLIIVSSDWLNQLVPLP